VFPQQLHRNDPCRFREFDESACIPAAYPPCQLMSRKITGGPNSFKKLAYIIMNGSAVGYEK